MARARVEKDFLGKVRVPADAYYGAETERAVENFPISGMKVPIEFIRQYALVKRSAALANMKLKKLDEKKGKAIVRACDDVIKGKFDNQFVTDVFQAGAGTSVNMNVNEVVANRAIEILGGKKGDTKLVHPNDHVNMSQSTNDTFPAAMHITTYVLATDRLIPSLNTLQHAFEKKAKEFKGDVKVGRTHLQDAVPMTLGQEFSGYAVSIAKQTDNISRAAKTMLTLSLGGTAVGTGIEASKAYSNLVVNEIKKQTKANFTLSKNFFDFQQNRAEEEWFSGALRDLAIAISKIANDLRLLASSPTSGLGDIKLPAVQPGSSIMPGKVNPSVPEMVNMVCFEVIGNDTTISYASESGQLELNVFMPLIAYNLVYSIKILSSACDVFAKKCVLGIKANEKKMKEGVEHDVSIATALAPYIGYTRAAQVARKAVKEGKTVRQVCIEMRIMPKSELDKILNPKEMTKRKR